MANAFPGICFFAETVFTTSAEYLDKGIARLEMLPGHSQNIAKIFGVRDQNRGHGIVSGSLHGGEIKPDQGRACLDMISGLDQRGIVLPVQLYRVQPDVDQHLGAAVRAQGYRVPGIA